MHPILAHPRRLGLYLLAWLPLAGLLALQIVLSTGLDRLESGVLALPLALVFAFVCLAAWYPCRAMPLGKAGIAAIVATQVSSALLSAALWVGALVGWLVVLARTTRFASIREQAGDLAPSVFAAGMLLYLLAAAGHYLVLAIQASQETESRNLELQIRAREAEVMALEARREHELAEQELALARSIQQRLLPAPELGGPGFQVAARNLPAHYVAGDFYDAFYLPDGSLALVVADVAGKGVGASLIMASVKAMLPLVAANESVVGTLGTLNDKLVGELAAREFVALCLTRFEPETRRLEIANAGLPDPYHLVPDRPPRPLEVPGERLPLGVRRGTRYASRSLVLAPGDQLLLITDGLPETATTAGEPLGYAALEELLDHRTATPAEWLDLLLERLRAATAPGFDDDLTALVLRTA